MNAKTRIDHMKQHLSYARNNLDSLEFALTHFEEPASDTPMPIAEIVNLTMIHLDSFRQSFENEIIMNTPNINE